MDWDGYGMESLLRRRRLKRGRLRRGWRKEYPESNKGRSARLVPFRDAIVGDIRPTLLVLSSGAGLLLLIAYVNVASLLLVRAESRKRETVLRGVLGASAGRLIRQFVTEGLLLVAVAVALAMPAASLAVQVDSRTPAARIAVSARRWAASACAAVRRRAAALLRGLLFGAQSWDVLTLITVAAVLGICALLASFVPARRAASVNPVDALRAE
jgi:ABC-type antimicrobial peptide transport system permease subunit